ncbi:PstS family phosphate ABC transporter substrate-binding protein [Paenibacillus sp. NFR01]|uniref:PstS family phosphate ABC transporter substrate-binding protein n=1 Tax=Paenibacillus sp. NFR01 TaxID=1566279 RepID=UPI0020C93507|nr:substrate-binding domain-containing protein [Paenibacillus sp. NFR01]
MLLFGGARFYVSLVVLAAVLLALNLVIVIFGWFARRTRVLTALGCVLLCLAAAGYYEAKEAYIDGLGSVDEREVNLHEYQPFANPTKAVRLDEPASYRIGSELPRLDGATALYPLYAAFVQAVYPANTYEPYDEKAGPVVCSSTTEAYRRLISGEADIIFAAAPSYAQSKLAKNKGVELKLTPIGREAFVFFVNRKNPVDGLTTRQIKDIYGGKATNWKDVGGADGHIRAFQRNPDSGSQTRLEQIMAGETLMTPPHEDVTSMMAGIIRETSSYRNYKNALGFSFLFYASEMNRSNKIKLLSIDGIAPSAETIRSGEYPYVTEFYAVTAGSANPNIQPFLDWILSPQGQKLVEQTGYVAIR